MVLLFSNPLLFGNQKYQRPMSVHYFSSSKAWINSVLGTLDRRMNFENLKVILFLDNATCHPERLQSGLTNIKLVLLPKNTTSRLQPLDAGIQI